ncbi:sulfatase-like hydrolase/transferase [bacterium SCSIO 12741]|nr:sulfatase-like hydrolase/transferase [bacterium SCSIO 12741]
MKKRLWIVLLFLLVIGLVYGLLPLSSDRWDIEWNEELRQGKLNYLTDLQAITSVSDTGPTRPPNIILIVADDLGKMDITTYGASVPQTPNLDQLSSEGVRFDEGYVTHPICSPSRAGLLTGRYPQRFGHEYHIHERYPKNRLERWVYKNFIATEDWRVAQDGVPDEEQMEKQGVPPSEILLSEVLHKAGYVTGIAGKWHLGYSQLHIPINRGFDHQFGFYEAFSLYQADTHAATVVNQHCPEFSDPFIWGKGREGNCAITRMDVVVEEPGYLTDQITNEAIGFMDMNRDRPFFLYVPYSAPHTPFQAQKKYYDQFESIEDPYQRIYYAMIRNLDDGIGAIHQKVKDLGLEENTLIVFLSDNGGATYTQATTNAPLKGGKMTHFEGGINVPFFMKWKGKVDSGSVCTTPVISTDVFRTIMDQVGLPMPSDRKYDGSDLVTLVNNDRSLPRDLYWKAGSNRAIRSGNWKFIEDSRTGSMALYRLDQDKNEQRNLAAENPEGVARMRSILDQWENELQPTLWPRVMDYRYETEDQVHYYPL